MLSYFRALSRPQLHAYLAALGGWSLDALDFFIFVFCLKSISGEFHTDVKAVAEGIFLTLAFRPVGALVFGWLAEKYGRRPILMLNVISYSAVQLATAFAPNLATLLALRAVFGFAMGGEWGVGAALALETLPARGRGFFSGLLQEGYVIGYLLASFLFCVCVRSCRLARHVHDQLGLGAAGDVHPLRRRGIPGLGGGRHGEACLGRCRLGRGEGLLPDPRVSGCADGLLQRLLARLPGPVSDLPAGPARILRRPRPARSPS